MIEDQGESSMLSSTLGQKISCLVLGFVVAIIAAYLLMYTSAIAAPSVFFDWFQSRGSLKAGLFLWDSTVVFGIGLGLPACIALLAVFRYFVISPLLCTIYFLVGVLFTALVLAPLLSNTSLIETFSRPWWGYGMEASLVFATLIALFLRHWVWPDNGFNTDACKAGTD